MQPRRRWLPLLVLLLVFTGAAGADVVDRVLAVVNGHLITLSDVRRVADLGLIAAGRAGDPTDAVLSQLIDRRLVLDEVERYAPPEPDAAIVTARVAAIQRQVGGQAEFDARLTVLGVDAAWLEQWVRDDLRIHAYIEQRFAGAMEATDDEIENYFRQHTGEFVRNGQPVPSAEAQSIARERVMAARRQALTDEWLGGLRKRAEITRPAKP
jgi:peptidyl-prolyl cis-trans isomerase SurA